MTRLLLVVLLSIFTQNILLSQYEIKNVDGRYLDDYGGIGIEFNIIEDTITVISIISGGPSEKVGLRNGDKIINIDGYNAIGIDKSEVQKMVKGHQGTKVTIDIFRNGVTDLIGFDIIREKISIETILVPELPWNKNPTENTFDYPEIKNTDNPLKDKVYKYENDKPILSGMGVLEMQAKLAHVFFNYSLINYYNIYIKNKAKRILVTNGQYNEETSKVVKRFQDMYMADIFKGDKSKYYGYGHFDEETKERLETIFQKLRREISRERRNKR